MSAPRSVSRRVLSVTSPAWLPFMMRRAAVGSTIDGGTYSSPAAAPAPSPSPSSASAASAPASASPSAAAVRPTLRRRPPPPRRAWLPPSEAGSPSHRLSSHRLKRAASRPPSASSLRPKRASRPKPPPDTEA